jgi:hypothetical protein
VRIIYADESGRGRPDEEPHFVVACAITHPDTQWQRLRRHYADLANDVFDLTGDDRLDEYVFHAKDIWHGSGDFNRSQFSLSARMKILNRLSLVPALYDIPICLGILDRASLEKESGTAKEARQIEHALAYAFALQYVDTWMAENCPGEVAMVTAEDTDEVKETIGFFHDGAKKLDEFDDFYDRGTFVTRTIVDAVNFAPKHTSPLLQIADHCAFLAKRTSVGCPHAKQIWNNIAPKVCRKNKHKGASLMMAVPVKLLDFSG